MPGRRISNTKIAQTDWSDPEEVAQLADELWKGRDYKRNAEAEAYRNIAFTEGRQWSVWDRNTRKMVRNPVRPKWQVQHVFNRILGQVQQATAKLIRSEPIWDVIPRTEDEEDRVVARFSKQVLDAYWMNRLNMNDVVQRLVWWAKVTKTVFLEVGWNPSDGEEVQVSRKDFALLQAAGDALSRGIPPQEMDDDVAADMRQAASKFQALFGSRRRDVSVMTGDVFVDVVPLFEMIVWPSDILEWEHGRVWMRSVKRTIQEVAEEYDLEEDEVRQMATSKTAAQVDSDYRSVLAARRGRPTSSSNRSDDMVLVHKLWHVKTRAFPRGRMAVVVGDTTVKLEDNPYPGSPIPFMPLIDIRVPGCLYGTSTVDQLISPQTEINLAASQLANFRNATIMPTIVEFGQPMEGELGNKPGGKVRYPSRDQTPTVLPRPILGPEHDTAIIRGVQMMNDIGGVSSVDLGNPRGAGLRSGRALAEAQEITDLRQVEFGRRLDNMLGKVGELILRVLQKFVKDERLVQIVGENNSLEAVRFSGMKLTVSDDPGRTALVTVRTFGRSQPGRIEARRTIDLLLQRGVLDPQRDREKILKVWEMGDDSQILDESRIDSARQEWEISQWRRGRLVGPPSKADNHEVHKKMIDRWIKTQEYRQLLQKSPEVAQNVDEHRSAHEKGIFFELMRQSYLTLHADVLNWLDFRAEWLQPEKGRIGQLIANTIFAAPLQTRQTQGAEAPQPPPKGASRPAGKTDGAASGRADVGQTKKANVAESDDGS